MKGPNREKAANFRGRFFISKCNVVDKFPENGELFVHSRINSFV